MIVNVIAFFLGTGGALLYYMLRDGREPETIIRRSSKTTPVPVERIGVYEALLRRGRALIDGLVQANSLWLDANEVAVAWLKKYDDSRVEESQLLEEAYDLLYGIQMSYRITKGSSILSNREVQEIGRWLRDYPKGGVQE